MRVTCTKCGKFTNGPIDSWVVDGVEQLNGPICITCFGKGKPIERIAPVKVPRQKGKISKGYTVYHNAWRKGWFSAAVYRGRNSKPRQTLIDVLPTMEEAIRVAIAAAKTEGTYNHAESEKYLKNI